LKPLKIFIHGIGTNELPALLTKLHTVAVPRLHQLVNDPFAADLMLLCGSWSGEDTIRNFTSDPIIRAHSGKCVAYTDDDAYLPLVPGVYCSPVKSFSTRIGRVLSYPYITRHVQKGNPFISPTNKPATRNLLFSFQGASTAFVRKRLFKTQFNRADVLIENTATHRNWLPGPDKENRQRAYVRNILRSHFVLCPRGGGSGSFRLFEVMRLGIAPVLLSDTYALPKGPDWNSFLIRIPESQIANLLSILEKHQPESIERGRKARIAWEQWFDTDKEFNQIIELCHQAHHASRNVESLIRASWKLMIVKHFAGRWIRRTVRAAILRILRLAGLRLPYSIRKDGAAFKPELAKDDIPES
jgi:hypothetical protein